MAEGDTLVNAIIGAVATALLSGFVPLAPLLGGGIAGYLEGGERDDGVRVGLLSGAVGLAISLVFFVVVFVFLAAFLAFVPEALGVFGAVGLLVLVLGTVMTAAYFLGLSALGGWLGNYVKHDTTIGD
ncbi:hypothetical protein HISP_04295 [Haloarcula hispanica N601]|uniref:DUF5518 domain-containing protein n=3 Tax=Haloarcula hispanica TaxID=51589 RepID=V5TJI2_HALHI|nr:MULTISPECIES: DUF5518 domain-containing protein [Haloarcula]AEM56450.1 conserved hypothetical protein [Haloarcula hispanica ATCC 33960]AHB65263.1 hypothetical protein HISP_04295 [Haloarcula hispanica N601]AJF26403.1 hypothetical protein SG26_12010 [Haloarcula sp. CBA1115]KAA9407775.1 hypothetical protein Har1131_13510 [Haloarcula sp. CBA1131]KAA9409177.1 hypothetical protein EGO51_05000 [Haloarcula hispanica]